MLRSLRSNDLDFDLQSILGWGIRFLILLPAIILHEVSHGYVAYLLGDPTAKQKGRLTLNPLAHIDPWGTIILPLMLLVVGSPVVIGWAKPVPVNPNYFKDFRKGMMLTGIAGPTTNLVLAAVAGLMVRIMGTSGLDLGDISTVGGVLLYFSWINLVLLFFNLVPIPPLDGSRVVAWLLPERALKPYHSLERYGFVIIFGLLWLAPGLFSTYMWLTAGQLLLLFTGL
jgi:Zn-dependent protease